MHLKLVVLCLLALCDVHEGHQRGPGLGLLAKDKLNDPLSQQAVQPGFIDAYQRNKRSENGSAVSSGSDTTQVHQKEATKPDKLAVELPKLEASHDVVDVKSVDHVPVNSTTPNDDTNQMKPGTIRRGIIVFGSLTFLFTGYMAYKIWRKTVETRNDNYLSETQMFKYGVLKSEDNTENMELARMPLTIDSDSDDDDDLEIFDLEQNKRLHHVKENYNNAGKSDIQILDLELPDQNKNAERNFVLLDLNNDMPGSSTSKSDNSFQ